MDLHEVSKNRLKLGMSAHVVDVIFLQLILPVQELGEHLYVVLPVQFALPEIREDPVSFCREDTDY